MDERLQSAYNFSNYRITLDAERKMAKIKLKERLIYSFNDENNPNNNGVFTISPELINFVYNLEQMGKEAGVLMDQNELPVQIDDLKAFRIRITDRYFEAMNDYNSKILELKNKRSVKALIEGK